MILLPYSRPWTQQPQEVADARAEWLRAYNFAQRGSDSANKAAPWTTGSLVYEAGQGGVGLRINAAATATSGEVVPGISTAITVVMIAEKFGAIVSNSDFLFGEHATSVGAYNFGFYESVSTGNLSFYVHNGSSAASAGASTAWRAGNGPQVWVGTFGGGDNNVRLYLNGAQVGSAALTGSVQRNTSALLRSCFWQSGAPNFRLYAGAVSGRSYTAQEIAEQFGSAHSAHSALFEPQRIWVPVSAGGGNISIDGNVGAATAAGTAGQVGVDITVSGNVGAATAAGTTAQVGVAIDIAGNVGAATAAGTAASVAVDVTVAGSVGNAVAAGITGGVDVGGNISIDGNVGAAVAAGVQGLPGVDITVNGSVGAAAAAGISGTVSLGNDITINGSVGSAAAAGILASLALEINLAGSVGNATAAGVTGTVTLSGAEVFSAPPLVQRLETSTRIARTSASRSARLPSRNR